MCMQRPTIPQSAATNRRAISPTSPVARSFFFFFQAEDGIRDGTVTGVQTCALPISYRRPASDEARRPLGLAVVGGLMLSQLVTLYLTPVVYTFMASILDRWRRRHPRSEERRVGKECRSGWSPDQ